eukprot:CAMPEP_0198604780 /NCGR_PEP_ID=MMETSP1462-20131121/153637_1 /TAXON_ID=1333877 /ORGANISM="Brandtodinium nutriculum, Strain RCC3387" /LENGTH=85 /DNA_ID=CAMNT_0044336569 /DNA_START=20 /DNA_END=274 /DNA_ORIENTATION=-
MILIARCLDRAAELVPEEARHGEAVDWPLIGQAAAGRPGRLAVGAIFFVDLVTSCVFWQVISGSCLELVFPGLDERCLLVAAGGA